MVRKKRGLNTSLIVFLIILSLIIGIGIGYEGSNYFNKLKDGKVESMGNTSLGETILGEYESLIKVPAVDNDGNGVSTDLIVKVEKGTGRTLVDIDTLLFWVDTQNSIRMAKIVAENITGLDLDNYDITYKVNANASLIGGESAGAALTIATIAALQNKKIRDDVMITGTINHDGSIGPIGGVLEKAKAAKEAKASIFLVPLLQSHEVVYEEKKHCEKFGFMEWCNVERIPKKVSIGNEADIEIEEVGSIKEALDYFYI
jgi:uncharacterized protein